MLTKLIFIIGGVIGLCLMESTVPAQREIAFQFLTSDSVLLDVYSFNDPAGIIEGYQAHIISPVCEDRLCYDAELEFYWDLLGDFTHFEVDRNKPLTKLDHIPFTPADYEKLNQILLTQSPSFIHLRRSELITPPELAGTPDVDGMTGATVKAVKKDMVEGAIYTCYTLWHIANGGISFEIQEHTKKKLDETLVRKWLSTIEAKAHYFLVENMEPSYFKVFLPEIIALAEGYDPFFMARLLEKLPAELYRETSVQNFFLHNFSRLEPAAQQELIDNLAQAGKPSKPVLAGLTEQIQPHQTTLNEQIIRLVCDQTEAAGIEVLDRMLDVLFEKQIALSPSTMELLAGLGEKYSSLKKKAKKLSRTK